VTTPRTAPTPTPTQHNLGDWDMPDGFEFGVIVHHGGVVVAVEVDYEPDDWTRSSPSGGWTAGAMSDPTLEDEDEWHAWHPGSDPTLSAMRAHCLDCEREIQRDAELTAEERSHDC
jgi:hypothetical protein